MGNESEKIIEFKPVYGPLPPPCNSEEATGKILQMSERGDGGGPKPLPGETLVDVCERLSKLLRTVEANRKEELDRAWEREQILMREREQLIKRLVGPRLSVPATGDYFLTMRMCFALYNNWGSVCAGAGSASSTYLNIQRWTSLDGSLQAPIGKEDAVRILGIVFGGDVMDLGDAWTIPLQGTIRSDEVGQRVKAGAELYSSVAANMDVTTS